MPASSLTAVVRKKLPDPATLPAVKALVQATTASADRGPLQAAYIVPNVLIGLLDCVVDNPEDVDAEAHMDALGLRPVWRLTRSSTPDGAPRVISARLKGAAVKSALLLLYGGVVPRASTRAATAAAAPGTSEAAAATATRQSRRNPPRTSRSTAAAPAPAPAAAACCVLER